MKERKARKTNREKNQGIGRKVSKKNGEVKSQEKWREKKARRIERRKSKTASLPRGKLSDGVASVIPELWVMWSTSSL